MITEGMQSKDKVQYIVQSTKMQQDIRQGDIYRMVQEIITNPNGNTVLFLPFYESTDQVRRLIKK